MGSLLIVRLKPSFNQWQPFCIVLSNTLFGVSFPGIFTRVRADTFCPELNSETEQVNAGFRALQHASRVSRTEHYQDMQGERMPGPYSAWIDEFLMGEYDDANREVKDLWRIMMVQLCAKAAPRCKIITQSGMHTVSAETIKGQVTVSDEAMIHLIMKHKVKDCVFELDQDGYKPEMVSPFFGEAEMKDDKEFKKRKAGRKKDCRSELNRKQEEYNELCEKISKARKADATDETRWGWYKNVAETMVANLDCLFQDDSGAELLKAKRVSVVARNDGVSNKKRRCRNYGKDMDDASNQRYSEDLLKELQKAVHMSAYSLPMPPLTGNNNQ